jgi:hypothetical protein
MRLERPRADILIEQVTRDREDLHLCRAPAQF